MDLLKTPHQLLMEEQGMHIDGAGLLNTPQQLLMEESGIYPKFAQGKKVEDMKAELFVHKTARPKFAAGGAASHPALVKAFNAYFK